MSMALEVNSPQSRAAARQRVSRISRNPNVMSSGQASQSGRAIDRNPVVMQASQRSCSLEGRAQLFDNVPAQVHCDLKTPPSTFQPEQHHRVAGSSDLQPPLSLDGGLNVDKCRRHTTRVSNTTEAKREQMDKIAFPSTSDPVWKDVNEELTVALPLVFSQKVLTVSRRLHSNASSKSGYTNSLKRNLD